MKITNKWWWLCGVFLLTTIAVMAQTNDTTLPGGPAPLPTNVSGYWELAIAGITPMLVTGLRWVAPKIPTMVLPLVTPFVGIGLGFAMNALGNAHLGWVDMAKAGALAVFVREAVNQVITKRIAADAAVPPATS